MIQKNYYEILGVVENASDADIKSAFRSLAKEYHPDRNAGNPGAETRFKEINEAYEVLRDPSKRRKYDQLRRYARTGRGGESISYEEFMRTFGGEQSPLDEEDEFTWGFSGLNLEEIFASLFGGRQQRQGRHGRMSSRGTSSRKEASQPHKTADSFFKRKGDDAYVDISLNLAQVLLGSRLRIRTPSGKSVLVRIPVGTQPGTLLRIHGMGFPRGNARGDLYIQTHVLIPTTLSAEEASLVRELAKKQGWKY